MLRRLIAENKINCDSYSLYIYDIYYPINSSGRFKTYPPYNDLFDQPLDTILLKISN